MPAQVSTLPAKRDVTRTLTQIPKFGIVLVLVVVLVLGALGILIWPRKSGQVFGYNWLFSWRKARWFSNSIGER